MKSEERFIKIAAPEGRILQGVVLPYNQVGHGDFGPEKFEARAFGDVENQDLVLNFQHDRKRPLARTPNTLEFKDSPEALTLKAVLPETKDGDDALIMAKSGILQGLSIHFIPIKQRLEGGIRVISEARLLDVAAVDKPSFEGSRLEARAIGGAGISFSVKYNSNLQCECCPTSDEVLIESGAFDEYLKDGSKELLAVHGNFSGAVASRKRGSLKIEDTDQGLMVSSDIADTQAGRDILEQSKDVEILGRLIIDYGKSETEVVDGITKVKKAHLRGFILGPSDSNKGWDPIKFTVDGEERKRILTCDARGIPFWL